VHRVYDGYGTATILHCRALQPGHSVSCCCTILCTATAELLGQGMTRHLLEVNDTFIRAHTYKMACSSQSSLYSA
jgi:hypothetical protein